MPYSFLRLVMISISLLLSLLLLIFLLYWSKESFVSSRSIWICLYPLSSSYLLCCRFNCDGNCNRTRILLNQQLLYLNRALLHLFVLFYIIEKLTFSNSISFSDSNLILISAAEDNCWDDNKTISTSRSHLQKTIKLLSCTDVMLS